MYYILLYYIFCRELEIRPFWLVVGQCIVLSQLLSWWHSTDCPLSVWPVSLSKGVHYRHIWWSWTVKWIISFSYYRLSEWVTLLQKVEWKVQTSSSTAFDNVWLWLWVWVTSIFRLVDLQSWSCLSQLSLRLAFGTVSLQNTKVTFGTFLRWDGAHLYL